MTNDSAWKQFDDDLEIILETTMQGNVEKKLNTLSTIVYNVGKERFGIEKQRSTRTVWYKEQRTEEREKPGN